MKPVLRRVPSLVGRIARGRPVPLGLWSLLQRAGRRTDALAPAARSSNGSDLTDPVLAEALRDIELGTWTIGPASIEVLRRALLEIQPRVVVEFGSGVSTVCLAHFGAGLERPSHVISIEQDAAEVERTRELLARLPRSSPVTIIHAPLEERLVEGRRLSSYALPDGDLERAIGDEPVDLVLIDGPAAEDGARFGTLPLVLSKMSPRALVMLDDALRDGELSAARAWVDLGFLNVDGIIPVDHGLLIGRAVATR